MIGPQETAERLNRLADAWENLAKDKVFGGMTLTQFRTAIKPSFDARAKIDTLNHELLVAQDERDDADKTSQAKAQLVVNGVNGDVEFGPDSALYEAMGYVRKSERRTGLTRKKKTDAAQ